MQLVVVSLLSFLLYYVCGPTTGTLISERSAHISSPAAFETCGLVTAASTPLQRPGRRLGLA